MNFSRLLGSLLGSAGGGMLGGMVGGRGGRMVGGLLGSMLGSKGLRRGGRGGGGGLLGKMFGGGKQQEEPRYEDYADEESQHKAMLLIRGMCNAAKCDGEVSEEEFAAITSRLGDLDPQEEEFLRNEFASPLDVEGYAASIPEDMAVEAYAVSLTAIKIDTGQETMYLARLAEALGIDNDTRREIHERMDAPWVSD